MDDKRRKEPQRMTTAARPGSGLPNGWKLARSADGTAHVTMPRGGGAYLRFSDFLGPTGPADLVLNLLWAVFALVFWLLWSLFGREEWRVGPELLEVRQAFLGRRSEERYTGETLAVEEQIFGRWALMLEAPEGRRLLIIGRPASVRALGIFLSEQTGWPLCLPPFGG
jgi:hypothetical protein